MCLAQPWKAVSTMNARNNHSFHFPLKGWYSRTSRLGHPLSSAALQIKATRNGQGTQLSNDSTIYGGLNLEVRL